MSPTATAAIAFALIVTCTIVGTLVRARMPEHHLTGDSKEVIRLATALVATLTGLVLALMFASTRTTFEHTSAAVSRLAVSLTELDEVLEDYGPPRPADPQDAAHRPAAADRFDLAGRCRRRRPPAGQPAVSCHQRPGDDPRAAAGQPRSGVVAGARRADRHRHLADAAGADVAASRIRCRRPSSPCWCCG